jgi:hypothetical protein
MMTEISGSTASSSSISREWFEDLSLEGEALICDRLLKKGGKKKPTLLKKKMKRTIEQEVEQIAVPTAARVPLKKKFVQNVEQMVESSCCGQDCIEGCRVIKGLVCDSCCSGV